MFQFVSSVLPPLRVGKAKEGRLAGKTGGANVGGYAHRPSKLYALAGSGGGFVGEAYLSDKGHSPVLFGVLFDA